MSIKNENPVGSVIAAIRSAKTATDNASARLVDAIYSVCEASFDSESVRKFFNSEAEYRTKVANEFFTAHDATFIRETAQLEKEADKEASKRNKDLIAELRQRHNYLRQQFVDALNAVYTLRCGFVDSEGREIEITAAALMSNGKFKVAHIDPDLGSPSTFAYTVRQLRIMGKDAMKHRKVGKADSAGKTDQKRSGLASLSPAKAIEAMATAFKGNVKSLLEAQAEADGTDSVSVADLADDTEKTIYNLAEDVIKTIFTGNDGVVDLDYFIDWCEKRAIKTTADNKRKRA